MKLHEAFETILENVSVPDRQEIAKICERFFNDNMVADKYGDDEGKAIHIFWNPKINVVIQYIKDFIKEGGDDFPGMVDWAIANDIDTAKEGREALAKKLADILPEKYSDLAEHIINEACFQDIITVYTWADDSEKKSVGMIFETEEGIFLTPFIGNIQEIEDMLLDGIDVHTMYKINPDNTISEKRENESFHIDEFCDCREFFSEEQAMEFVDNIDSFKI